MEETMGDAWHIRKNKKQNSNLKETKHISFNSAHEYTITEYDLKTFNYYIVQESLLRSLFYYTINLSEI